MTVDSLDPDDPGLYDGALGAACCLQAFITFAIQHHDLAGAWAAVHPDLRREWVERWIQANRIPLKLAGRPAGPTADALLEQTTAHPLWGQFAGVLVRELRACGGDLVGWKISLEPKPVALDQELVYIEDTVGDHGGAVIPVVMHYAGGDEWQLRNIGTPVLPATKVR